MTFKIGNKAAARVKPVRDAITLELKSDNGLRLRRAVQKVMQLAAEGEQWAAKELFDRVDGKVAQALIGGDDEDTQLQITVVNYTKPKE